MHFPFKTISKFIKIFYLISWTWAVNDRNHWFRITISNFIYVFGIRFSPYETIARFTFILIKFNPIKFVPLNISHQMYLHNIHTYIYDLINFFFEYFERMLPNWYDQYWDKKRRKNCLNKNLFIFTIDKVQSIFRRRKKNERTKKQAIEFINKIEIHVLYFGKKLFFFSRHIFILLCLTSA